MDTYLKIFCCKLSVYTLVVVLLIILSIWIFGSDNQLLLVAISIGTSIYASFLVGAFFQNLMKEDFSKEHFMIMQHKDALNESGIVKYYGSFKDAVQDLKCSIQRSEKVIMYFAYGYSLLNNLSEELSDMLRRKDSEINIYMLAEDNPFVKTLQDYWKIKDFGTKIKDSKEILQNKLKELSNNKELNGELKLYLNKKYPINYSFYICDDEIYVVPSKIYDAKEWVPFAIRAQKTINKKALYNKFVREFELMHKKETPFEEVNL
ncbi:hypothetical protein EMN47_03845 [Prolixibacteraceae bacterium JC049]|nr:hypothetical protein [Prolixibacteraceae bacterium JC049]